MNSRSRILASVGAALLAGGAGCLYLGTTIARDLGGAPWTRDDPRWVVSSPSKMVYGSIAAMAFGAAIMAPALLSRRYPPTSP